jgi:hypothetical protein
MLHYIKKGLLVFGRRGGNDNGRLALSNQQPRISKINARVIST